MKKTKGLLGLVLATSVLTAGCATSPNRITPNFVSPVKYSHFTCGQLAMEIERIQGHANVLHSGLERRRNNDKLMTGVGIVVAWPALFFIKGNDTRKAEFSQLRGDFEAAKTAHNFQRCGVMLDPDQQMPATPVAHSKFDESVFRQLLTAKDCVTATRMALNYGSNYHQQQAAQVCRLSSIQR